eukprot:6466323-Amphidinium_carterae.3
MGWRYMDHPVQAMYTKAGVKDEGVMFLFTDGQITNEKFLVAPSCSNERREQIWCACAFGTGSGRGFGLKVSDPQRLLGQVALSRVLRGGACVKHV